ncbi:hypothetical protein ACA910_007300 [Epithemia clementina (nom. ined.)]
MFSVLLHSDSKLNNAVYLAHGIKQKKLTLEEQKMLKKKARLQQQQYLNKQHNAVTSVAPRKKLGTKAPSTSTASTCSASKASASTPNQTNKTTKITLRDKASKQATRTQERRRPSTIMANSPSVETHRGAGNAGEDNSSCNLSTASSLTGTQDTKADESQNRATPPLMDDISVLSNGSAGRGHNSTFRQSSSNHSSTSSSLGSNSDFYFQHSLVVDQIWQNLKATIKDYQVKLGEQILLRMMELDPMARQDMEIASLRSQRVEEISQVLVVVVDLMVSVYGPDLELYAEDLEQLGRECTDKGIRIGLLSKAVPHALQVTMQQEQMTLTEQERESWAVVVDTVSQEMTAAF